ncbi:MAG: ATP-binding protein [Bdellovibrio sp.]|nr:ATP-binding protein [Bdellovibrio sp.]
MEIEQVRRRGKAVDAVIESKDQRWHCRNRITLIFGSNDVEDLETYIYTDTGIQFRTVKFHQAKSKAIEEILDNCIDEYYRGHVTEIHTTLDPDRMRVTVEDNGIGFPLDKIEQVYSEFRTGSKFKDDEVDEKGFLHRTLGQNGLGAAATCLTSDVFIARVRHYNKGKEQTYTFTDGALKISKTKPKPFKGHSGVRIEFVLSKEVYKDNVIDQDLLRKRIIDLAYNNPGLLFTFNGEKYLFKKGLFELAQKIDPVSAVLFGEESTVFETVTPKGRKAQGKIDITLAMRFDKTSEEREHRIKRIFVNTIKDKLERNVKKEKLSLVDNDVLTGMTFILGITMPNPRFESQTKRKLVRDINIEKALETFMTENMDRFIRKQKEFLDTVMERASFRHRFQELKDASKMGKKQKKQRVEKLLDANERRDRTKCSLFICEGDSAIGGLRSGRDKLYHGGIALKGKPMNVSQASIADVLANQEFADIMASIGLTIGQPVVREELRFANIVFLADSDVDGGHINTLLTNFFYTFWPELFEMGAIQMAKAPLFEVLLDKGTRFFESVKELEEFKNGGAKIKEIFRNKGLGEMSPEAWKHVMGRKSYTKIAAIDAAKARQVLDVCFGKDVNQRKSLLLDTEAAPVGDPGVVNKKKKTTKKAV